MMFWNLFWFIQTFCYGLVSSDGRYSMVHVAKKSGQQIEKQWYSLDQICYLPLLDPQMVICYI